MAMTMHCDIVSAESEIFSGTVTMVFAPAEMGDVGITPRHSALLTRLRPGEVRVQTAEGQEQMFFVSGGILEVQPHVVTVLADTAMRARDLDEAAALQAKEQAERQLADRRSDFDYARAQAELAEAVAQLRTIQKLRDRRRA
ncbi:MAG TPA: F0F1 ATP synthase subunit epsilon [Gammaproteobacteria bacterium]|nr:F0F1 ATP synthase subunit epsilon [Gammaproteobacteria bacterium]